MTYTAVTYQNLIPILTDSSLTPPPLVSTPLKFCHRNLSNCYGCRALFITDGYPKKPFDLPIVLKTQRSYVDNKTRQKTRSSDFSNFFFSSAGASCLSMIVFYATSCCFTRKIKTTFFDFS